MELTDQIKKARLLYLDKGILKREYIRNEVSFSWARSSFQNVNVEKLKIIETPIARKLIMTEEEKKAFFYINAIVIIDQNGKVIRSFLNDDTLPYDAISYDESSLGTNGIGLAFNKKEEMYVSKYEHFHKSFFDKLTFGVPKVNGTTYHIVGFILDLSTAEFLEIRPELVQLAQKIMLRLNIDNHENPKKINHSIDQFYQGKSEKIHDLKRKINQLASQENNVFLCGAKGVGKEMVARFIHEMSNRKNEKFYALYCDKLPSNVIIDEYFMKFKECLENSESTEYGVVYCESIEALSMKAQEVLTKLLECKPVNSKSENDCKQRGYRFIFSSKLSLNEMQRQNLIKQKLINRINVFTVLIPSLTELKEDLPLMISHRIDKYVEQLFLDPIVFSETLIKELTRYKWPENYRELDKTIEQIIHSARHEKVIDSSYLPERMRDKSCKSKVILPLEKTEEAEIIRALELMDNNVALTARALGIGRSTLYRKLDKYNIIL